jgi:nitroreductase
MDRRQFLVLVGSAAVYASLRPAMALAKREPSYSDTLQPWAIAADPGGNPADVARALVGAAVLAPSLWNTQPWRFEAEGNRVRIVSDVQRWMQSLDPEQKNLHLSLGCALENLLIATRAYGLRTSVSYLPHDGLGNVAAEVTWMPGDAPRDRQLFDAIPSRRTNRQDYDGRGIFLQNRARLTAQVADDTRLHWLDDHDRLDDLSDTVRDVVHDRVLDPRAQAERFRWMRPGDDDARKRGDGVTVDELEFGGLAHWLAGRYFNPRSMFLRFGAEHAAKQARSQVRSAGALALITTARPGKAQWLASGQAYERLALTATALGIAQQPMSEPLETEAGRNAVLQAFGVSGEQPLMLVRLGHARNPQPSVRRAVALVASFRTT